MSTKTSILTMDQIVFLDNSKLITTTSNMKIDWTYEIEEDDGILYITFDLPEQEQEVTISIVDDEDFPGDRNNIQAILHISAGMVHHQILHPSDNGIRVTPDLLKFTIGELNLSSDPIEIFSVECELHIGPPRRD